MEIDAASLSSMAADQTRSQIGVAVARKTMDVAKQQGEAAVQLIQSAAKVQEQTSHGANNHLVDVTA